MILLDYMPRKHLSTREHSPFNEISKVQEKEFSDALIETFNKLTKKYPNLKFDIINNFEIESIIKYLNRGRKIKNKKALSKKDIEAENTQAKGLKPDGKIWIVESKKDKFPLIFCVVEIKHQGKYDGYTPITKTDAKKQGIKKEPFPPQAQGNAIERFAKNLNAFRTLNRDYDFNPYIIFCDGFDFHNKDEFNIFKHQPYSKKYEGKNSSIRFRLIAGNEFKKLNKIYVVCEDGVCPATIMARMKKWEKEEIERVMIKFINKSLKHLQNIGEIDL